MCHSVGFPVAHLALCAPLCAHKSVGHSLCAPRMLVLELFNLLNGTGRPELRATYRPLIRESAKYTISAQPISKRAMNFESGCPGTQRGADVPVPTTCVLKILTAEKQKPCRFIVVFEQLFHSNSFQQTGQSANSACFYQRRPCAVRSLAMPSATENG